MRSIVVVLVMFLLGTTQPRVVSEPPKWLHMVCNGGIDKVGHKMILALLRAILDVFS